MADEDEYIGPSRENYLPCSVCGRTFAPQSLKKHINVCRKQATKKRKVFDSQRQRFDGTEISTLKPKLASAKQSQPLPQKKSNWRQEHEEFVKTIRAAKGVTQALKEGGPLPPPPPPSLNPDYVQCPCCQRRFNEGAAERHIMFCKEQAARIGRSGPSQQASSRLAVRIQVPVQPVPWHPGYARPPQRGRRGRAWARPAAAAAHRHGEGRHTAEKWSLMGPRSGQDAQRADAWPASSRPSSALAVPGGTRGSTRMETRRHTPGRPPDPPVAAPCRASATSAARATPSTGPSSAASAGHAGWPLSPAWPCVALRGTELAPSSRCRPQRNAVPNTV
ncbi:zinc finger C2HC domain-containing protein 1B-like isoform X3 [Lampetra planeri]